MLWLHTDGRYIKDSYGQVVNLRGAAIEDPNNCQMGVSKYWGQEDGSYAEMPGYLPNSFDLLKSSGVNFIRLGVNPVAYMGIPHEENCTGTDDASVNAYRENLDLLISEFAKRNIYCYMDMHSFFSTYKGSTYWQEFVDVYHDSFIAFLKDVAQRYIDQPAMIGVGINEPRDFYNDYPYTGYWWDFMLECAREMHSINPKLIWLCPSTEPIINGEYWGDIYGVSVDAGYKIISDEFRLNPLPEPNIIYVFHNHYPQKSPYPAQFDYLGPPEYDYWNPYANGENEKGKQLFENFLYFIAFSVSEKLNLPVANVEFNVKANDVFTDPPSPVPYDYLLVTNDFLGLMNKYGCNWSWWTWGGSVGYTWDYSPESNSLIYATEGVPAGAQIVPIWNKLTYLGEVWKNHLAPPKPSMSSWLIAIPVLGLILSSWKKKG